MWSLKSVFRFNDCNRDRFVANMARQIPSGSKVLDAGAGPCRYKPLFEHCDYHAQDFASYTGENHRYGKLDYVGDISSIPVRDGYFDCVLCTEVLEHIPEPQLAVREFSRILRAGGVLIVTAPLGSGIHMPPYHYYGGFTRYWYEHVLPQHGFEIQSCQENEGFFKLYGQESQRFLHMLTPRGLSARVVFYPLKVLLALWFRGIVPVACHFLDRLDQERRFTAGYFVVARKRYPTLESA